MPKTPVFGRPMAEQAVYLPFYEGEQIQHIKGEYCKCSNWVIDIVGFTIKSNRLWYDIITHDTSLGMVESNN